MPAFDFRISNDTSRIAAFYLEPWGGKYTIAPHKSLRVAIEAPSCPVLEWELSDEVHALVVKGPANASATVYDGDIQVTAE